MIDSSQLTYYSASETRSDRRVVVVKEHIASEMAPGLDSCTCGTSPIKARAMDEERRTMRHQIYCSVQCRAQHGSSAFRDLYLEK